MHSFLIETIILAVVLYAAASERKQGATKPDKTSASAFDDLRADEVRSAVLIISASYPAAAQPSLRYSIVRTQEPPKSRAKWHLFSNSPVPTNQRLAYAAVFDLSSNQLTEFVVDLNEAKIVSRRDLGRGVSPPVLQTEAKRADALVRANSKWRAAMEGRGLEPGRARFDIWVVGPGAGASGDYASPNGTTAPGHLLRVITNYQDPASRFWYWTVVEGLIVTVDVRAGAGTGVVVSVWDDDKASYLAPAIKELSTGANPHDRLLKPLLITQPEGSSIHMQGQQLTWYKWRLRYSVDPLYGLRLHQVSYAADCAQQRRAVAYKISLGELFVPYGAKGRDWRWRGALDVGQYGGVGKNAVPLRHGVDVPDNALLFDCLVVDEATGEPSPLPGCVAAYEKDAPLLYKHVDLRTEDTDARRGRVLVLTMMATVGNYDYGFEYVFHMDGVLEVRTRLTGIVLAQGVIPQSNDPECIEDCLDLLNNYLVGPIHQHFFSYRIDLDVDGVKNHVFQVDVTADGQGGGAFSSKKKLLANETGCDHNLRAHRTWRVVNAVNAGSRNLFGSPRGYALRPATVAFPYLPESSSRPSPWLETAPFMKHPFWVTRFHDSEQAPGLRFPRRRRSSSSMQAGLVGGLPKYVSNNESVAGEDLVLWYTFGVTHQTRPEEWPIMNVHDVQGFVLVPFNFGSVNGEMALEGVCHV